MRLRVEGCPLKGLLSSGPSAPNYQNSNPDPPDPDAANMASSATTVLPHPTSPCSSRIITPGPARSDSTSRSTLSCEAVNLYGRAARADAMASSLVMEIGQRGGRVLRCACSDRCWMRGLPQRVLVLLLPMLLPVVVAVALLPLMALLAVVLVVLVAPWAVVASINKGGGVVMRRRSSKAASWPRNISCRCRHRGHQLQREIVNDKDSMQ